MTLKQKVALAGKIATVLDTTFHIGPVTFGLDPILDAIPWLGGLVSVGASLYLFYLAYLLKVPRFVYMRMLWNVFVDYIIGQLPLGFGIVVDAFYKSNVLNFELIKKYAPKGDVMEGVVV